MVDAIPETPQNVEAIKKLITLYSNVILEIPLTLFTDMVVRNPANEYVVFYNNVKLKTDRIIPTFIEGDVLELGINIHLHPGFMVFVKDEGIGVVTATQKGSIRVMLEGGVAKDYEPKKLALFFNPIDTVSYVIDASNEKKWETKHFRDAGDVIATIREQKRIRPSWIIEYGDKVAYSPNFNWSSNISHLNLFRIKPTFKVAEVTQNNAYITLDNGEEIWKWRVVPEKVRYEYFERTEVPGVIAILPTYYNLQKIHALPAIDRKLSEPVIITKDLALIRMDGTIENWSDKKDNLSDYLYPWIPLYITNEKITKDMKVSDAIKVDLALLAMKMGYVFESQKKHQAMILYDDAISHWEVVDEESIQLKDGPYAAIYTIYLNRWTQITDKGMNYLEWKDFIEVLEIIKKALIDKREISPEEKKVIVEFTQQNIVEANA